MEHFLNCSAIKLKHKKFLFCFFAYQKYFRLQSTTLSLLFAISISLQHFSLKYPMHFSSSFSLRSNRIRIALQYLICRSKQQIQCEMSGQTLILHIVFVQVYLFMNEGKIHSAPCEKLRRDHWDFGKET